MLLLSAVTVISVVDGVIVVGVNCVVGVDGACVVVVINGVIGGGGGVVVTVFAFSDLQFRL